MMGHSHALSGVVGWMAVVPLVQGREFLGLSFHLGPGEIIAGSLVCAGAALLPDLDHKSATVTKTYGKVTEVLSGMLGFLFGGHRMGTHSFFFAVLMGVLVQLLALWSELAVQVFVFLLIGIALQGLGFGLDKNKVASGVINAMATAGITLALFTAGVNYSWLGLAVAFGVVLHFFGDMITKMGVPIFWPFFKKRFGQGKGFVTDGPVEQKFVTPLLTIGVIVGTIYLFDWPALLPEY
ncbi:MULTISPECIES: metal-dependent hydrolase [Nocardiopsis]|uniref:Membrane-bound metal-dependent hydrolase n=1 Tax=Nocardiopsis dassonvillei (strain ATCC 23218 / DSM 43111 / CIP 107115 / JCM 7437 / KCTC 9190 / NBRC 14626 / NCTC 10488 / NRRL B-5397 / IMRU 509) TaxID=446468 RepID=D7AXK2_NOCDD|nr:MULTISPECIES: metal-dependent hydrolase [Nocardiopsis]ADH66076.1 membrane-bound metal-dependent hydrolase [Nocardiopsis dassonvillei subsp. dassonvillei DSM 43111]ASU61234.1 metal-dependent hydrolase [Nocardiopsis dassonvillei]NKY78626.1 metal-dependent hydrolase [Nocardiopsis dassonvillei]VEI92096.1 inner membrane protein [Nocardiopsis dassonvillei]